jgi:hypothetical protein
MTIAKALSRSFGQTGGLKRVNPGNNTHRSLATHSPTLEETSAKLERRAPPRQDVIYSHGAETVLGVPTADCASFAEVSRAVQFFM